MPFRKIIILARRTLIGYDTTERLTYTPPKLEIIVTKCPNQPECGVRQLSRPESLIEGNRYDTSVAAEIITAKYGYHQPFYRQQDLFTSSGWTPFRSTLLNILTTAAGLVRPLLEYFADEVRTDSVIGTDDTGGTLLGDCYGGYTGISLRSDANILHAACNAHARRKVFEARHNHPQIASVLLAMYQELYDVEDEARGADQAGRLELRQQKSTLVWARMREYLDCDEVKRLLPKEEMGKAVGYLNNHWHALQVYVSRADVAIDNNAGEQLMKQVAIGRKNWLFIGSIPAGERAADMMTLVSSAIRNDLHVWSYVKGVLDALLSGCTDYHSLRPDAWATEHPDQIRTYRVDERRDKADRKQRQRAQRQAAQA